MEKFFDDFLSTSFVKRGLMTCGACSFMQEIAEYPLIMFSLLLEYGCLTGNWEFIRERYAAFADILDFYREEYAEPDGLLNHLDKWCVVEWPDPMRDGYDVDLTEGRPCNTKHNVINAYTVSIMKNHKCCISASFARLGAHLVNSVSQILTKPRDFCVNFAFMTSYSRNRITLTLGAAFLTDWDIAGILRFSERSR